MYNISNTHYIQSISNLILFLEQWVVNTLCPHIGWFQLPHASSQQPVICADAVDLGATRLDSSRAQAGVSTAARAGAYAADCKGLADVE